MVIGAIFSLGNDITVDTPAPAPSAAAGLKLGLGLRTVIDLSSSLWSPCGLLIPKATIRLENTEEIIELIMFSFFLGL